MPQPSSPTEPISKQKKNLGSRQGRAASLPADPIRAELNIEKWPALWRPAHSPRTATVRVLEREQTLKDGTHLRARVEVGFSHLGELTTEDQKTYYALVKHWEEGGRSAQQTFFSIRALARSLCKRWGTNVITSITDSLRRLRATPVSWENAYFDSGHHETLEEIEMFNVLAELKIVRRKVDGQITREAGYFRFNDFTLNNLLANHTKPVLFETILRFRSEVAQLLYAHLDLILANKRAYERRSKELFRDLGLTGTEYERVYERKRALERALAELKGVPLTTGMIARIGIGKTRDGSDYKVAVTKGSARSQPMPGVEADGGVATIRPPASPSTAHAEELVKHFYKRFHNVERIYPQSKELNQATALAARHGFDRAKYVVDFAYLAAAKTGYLPQTFGGILQYTSRAITAYEDFLKTRQAAANAREEAKARETFELLQAQMAEKKRREAEERLAKLPKPEYDAFYAKTKAAIVKRSVWLQGQSEESEIFQHVIRGAMIAELISSGDLDHRRAA